MCVKCRNLSFMVVPFISLDEYEAVQVVLVDFVDEDTLGVPAQEEEGDGAERDVSFMLAGGKVGFVRGLMNC